MAVWGNIYRLPLGKIYIFRGMFMSIMDKLKDAIKDMASLEVLTFTGNVSATITDGNAIDWENMIEKAKTGGEVQLVAATKIEFDRDTKLFIASGVEAEILAAHEQAVANATTVRQSFLKMVTDKISD